MAIDKDTIKETGNVLTKLTSSERGTFLVVMLTALIAIVATVVLYIYSVDNLVTKYNDTINMQQKEFLSALKEFTK
jgi:cell division protein FtsL